MGRCLGACYGINVLSTMVHGADDAKSTVAKMNEAWQAAYKAADFDRLSALYAEDAVLMPDGREPVQGRRAVRNKRSKSRSEEHTSELQSHLNLVCRLLLEKKKRTKPHI